SIRNAILFDPSLWRSVAVSTEPEWFKKKEPKKKCQLTEAAFISLLGILNLPKSICSTSSFISNLSLDFTQVTVTDFRTVFSVCDNVVEVSVCCCDALLIDDLH